MVKELPPLQGLDVVLNWLNTTGFTYEKIFELLVIDKGVIYITFDKLFEGLNLEKQQIISKVTLSKILNKLETDKYITVTNDRYSITWEGVLFIDEKEGYVKQRRKEKSLKALQLSQTWVLIIGSVCGLIWACFQIYDRLHRCCSCHLP